MGYRLQELLEASWSAQGEGVLGVGHKCGFYKAKKWEYRRLSREVMRLFTGKYTDLCGSDDTPEERRMEACGVMLARTRHRDSGAGCESGSVQDLHAP